MVQALFAPGGHTFGWGLSQKGFSGYTLASFQDSFLSAPAYLQGFVLLVLFAVPLCAPSPPPRALSQPAARPPRVAPRS